MSRISRWAGRSARARGGFGRAAVTLTMATSALGGCATVKDAYDVKLVSFVSDPDPGSSLGKVIGKDCATQVFGYGRNPLELNAENAVRTTQESRGVRYFKQFNIGREEVTIAVYQRTCLTVSGEGFR